MPLPQKGKEMARPGHGRLGAKRIPNCVGKKDGVFRISEVVRAVKGPNVNISMLKTIIPSKGTQVAVRVGVEMNAIGRQMLNQSRYASSS